MKTRWPSRSAPASSFRRCARDDRRDLLADEFVAAVVAVLSRVEIAR